MPHAEQGSGAVQGLGWLGSEGGGAAAPGRPRAACSVTCSVISRLWLGMHSKHLRLPGSNFICRLL